MNCDVSCNVIIVKDKQNLNYNKMYNLQRYFQKSKLLNRKEYTQYTVQHNLFTYPHIIINIKNKWRLSKICFYYFTRCLKTNRWIKILLKRKIDWRD